MLRRFGAPLLIITGCALLLRSAQLDRRPLHGDEAVHAWKLNELYTTGHYAYDPHEYHGPTLYYATLPLLWLQGADDWRDIDARLLRFVPVLFGVMAIAAFGLLRDGVGRAAALTGALLAAVSPALVFYSRYYIQETLLACFTLLALGAGWRFLRSGRLGWALTGGAAFGLMHATKETAIIAWGCAAFAIVVTRLVHGRKGRAGGRTWKLIAAGSVAAVVSVAAFSVGFSDWRGVFDSVRTYATYFARAGGAEALHLHPWHYYAKLLTWQHPAPGLWWSEGLIAVLALAGIVSIAVTALRHFRRNSEVRSDKPAPQPARDAPGRGGADFRTFLAVYVIALAVVYSVIPYKTPWCLVQFWLPACLLAGCGVVALWRALRRRAARGVLAILLLVGSGHLAWQAWQLNTRFAGDYRNPYVYAQPLSGVERLADWVDQLAAVRKADFAVHVLSGNPWPLPWYLRRYDQVGYWEAPLTTSGAAVIIAEGRFEDEVAQRSAYRGPFYYGLRPDAPLAVFVEPELWDAFVAANRAAD